MTHEEVQKLVKLQQEINDLQRAEDVMVKRQKAFDVDFANGYVLPINLVEGLRDQMWYWLLEEIIGQRLALENKLDELHLCIKVEEPNHFYYSEKEL